MVSPAEKIAQEAKKAIDMDPEKKRAIEALKPHSDRLFGYFIEKVKSNNYHEVSYILNACFADASGKVDVAARAAFGNQGV